MPAAKAKMARKTRSGDAARLAPQEIAVLERLVERGALVAVPRQGTAKPRKVVAASLAGAGTRVLLYLSTKTIEL